MSEMEVEALSQPDEGIRITFPFKDCFDDPEKTQNYTNEDVIRHAREFVLLNDRLLAAQSLAGSSTTDASKLSECLDGLLQYLVSCMHAVAWSLVRFNEGKGLPSKEFQKTLEEFMGRILNNIRWSVEHEQNDFRNENLKVISNCCSESACSHDMLKEISLRFASAMSPAVKELLCREYCKLETKETSPNSSALGNKDFFRSSVLLITPSRARISDCRNEKPSKVRDVGVNLSTIASIRAAFTELGGVSVITKAFTTNIQDLQMEIDQQYVLMVIELFKQSRSLPWDATQWFFRILMVVMWNTVRGLTSDDSTKRTSFCEQLMLCAFEFGKKVEFIHFKYNLELIYACYVFTNSSQTCLDNYQPRLSMIRMAVSIILTMLKRAAEDSDWKIQDNLQRPDLEVLRSACRTAPNDVGEDVREWDCKTPYSMIDRVTIFFSVCGASTLKFCYDYLKNEMVQPEKEGSTAKLEMPAGENNEPGVSSSKKKTQTADHQSSSAAANLASSLSSSDKEIQGASLPLESSKRSYDLTDAILILMEDWMFRFDAHTCFGPLVQTCLDADVLDSFLLFLNVASETVKGKIRGRLSRWNEVTQLLIDNKYISGAIGGKLVKRMWLKDSLVVPGEVLRLLVRVLLNHMEQDCEEASVMAMQMWESTLDTFRYLLERSFSEGDRGICGVVGADLTSSASRDLDNVVELTILLSFGFHTLETEKKGTIFKELVSMYAKTTQANKIDHNLSLNLFLLVQHFSRHFDSPHPQFLDDLSNIITIESSKLSSFDLQVVDRTMILLNGAYVTAGSNPENFSRWHIMADVLSPGKLDPSIRELLAMNNDELYSALLTASSTFMKVLYVSPSPSCNKSFNAVILLMAWRFLRDLDGHHDNLPFQLDDCVAVVNHPDLSVFDFLMQLQKMLDFDLTSRDQLLQLLRNCCQLVEEVGRDDGNEQSAMRATVSCFVMDALTGMQTMAIETFFRNSEDVQGVTSSAKILPEVIDLLIGSLHTSSAFLFSAWSLCIDRCMSDYPRFSSQCVKLGFPLPCSELPAILQDERSRKLRDVRTELLSVLPRPEEVNSWLLDMQASVAITMGNSEIVGDSHANTLVSLAGQIFNQMAVIRRLLGEKANEGTEMSKNAVEKLSILMAQYSVDCRLQHFLSGGQSEALTSISSIVEDYQNLIDVSKMHRIDLLLDSVQAQDMSLEGSACDVLHEAFNTLQEIVVDSKRCSSFVWFYFDSSSRTGTTSQSVLLIELASTKGNILCILDVLNRAKSLPILRRVVKLFRSILENPAAASLARSKPAVRRKIAEYFTSLGKKQTKRLLEKLLLNSSNSPDRSAVADSNHGTAQDAAMLRRSTLRLFALVLDGVDESIEQFENILLDAMFDLIPKMVKCPKAVVRECFAGVKFVCFRQSQSRVEQMIDLIVDSLGSSQDLGTPECAANLADMLSSLIASLQSSSRQPFSDLGSVTSGQVRASDTLSTVSTSSEVSNEGGMSYTSRGESTVATSAITYISSTGHMDPDDSSAVGSHMDCASIDMDGDAGSVEDDEDSLRECQPLMEEEQEETAEESDKRLASKVCTYIKTSNTFSEQHWYHCWTCGLVFQEGCCAVCAKVCHRGHDVTYSRYSRFFCDCGAGKRAGHTCSALAPRENDSASPNGQLESNSGNVTRSADVASSGRMDSQEEDAELSNWISECDRLPGQLTRQVRESLLHKLRCSQVSQSLTRIYDNLVATIESNDCGLLRDAAELKELKVSFSQENKQIQLRRSLKPGSFSTVGLGHLTATTVCGEEDAANKDSMFDARGQTRSEERFSLLSLTTTGMIVLVDGDQFVVVDGRKKLLEASSTSFGMEKASVKIISKASVSFPIFRLSCSFSTARYVAAAGKCSVMNFELSPSGKVVGSQTFDLPDCKGTEEFRIVDVMWLPTMETHLLVVTTRFCHIFDVSSSSSDPLLSMADSEGERLKGATIIHSLSSTTLLVLTDTGVVKSCDLRVDSSQTGLTLPIDKRLEFPAELSSRRCRAMFFSNRSRLLLCSFDSHELLVSTLDSDDSALKEHQTLDFKEYKMIPDRFVDVGHTWGQILVATDSGAAGVLQIGSTIRFSWLQYGSGSSAQVVGISQCTCLRPSLPGMLLLNDDGSLQSWILSDASTKASDSSTSVEEETRGASKVTFPIDFFEKGVCITQKVKISGDGNRGPVEVNRKLNGSNEPLISSQMDQMKIVVQNSNPEFCMIGFLVLVGDALMNNIPSEFHVHDRIIETKPGVKRWYPVPFTNDEILNSDKEVVLSIVGCHSPGNPPAIDQLEVYGMRKDKFGFNERQKRQMQLLAMKEKPRKAKRAASRCSDPLEKTSISILNCLAVHWSVGGLQSLERDFQKCREKFLSELPQTLLQRRPISMRPALKRLLKVLFPSKDVYCESKDQVQLRSFAEVFDKIGKNDLAALQNLSASNFSLFSGIVSRVLARRPNHFGSIMQSRPNFLDNMVKCFWMIFDTPNWQLPPELEPSTDSFISAMHSYASHLIQLALLNLKGPVKLNAGCSIFSSNSPSLENFRKIVECLIYGLQCQFPRIRYNFCQHIELLAAGSSDSTNTEVHFEDANQTHDHTDPLRLGPMYWEECIVSDQVLEQDGQSSIVYCCDKCGLQPVVGTRWHCRVCKDFDLCNNCYQGIREAGNLHDSSRSPTDVWLYPANVDPTDEEALLKLAISLSLEVEQPRSVDFFFASEFLYAICKSIPLLFDRGGACCVPTFYLVLKFANGNLRDDGETLAALSEAVSDHILTREVLSPTLNTRQLQPFCYSLKLLTHLVSGPSKSMVGRKSSEKLTEKTLLLWQPNSTIGLNPETLKILSREKFLSFLHRSFEAAVDELEKNDSSAVSELENLGGKVKFLSPSWLLKDFDRLHSEDGAIDIGPEEEEKETSVTSAVGIVEVIANLGYRLNACQEIIAMAGGSPAEQSRLDVVEPVGCVQSSALGKDWTRVLCRCLNLNTVPTVRKAAKKVLKQICGAEEDYHGVVDLAVIQQEVKTLQSICVEIKRSNELPHKDTVRTTMAIESLLKIAKSRVRNWQKYCNDNTGILDFLMEILPVLPNEVVEGCIKLLSATFLTQDNNYKEAVGRDDSVRPKDDAQIASSPPSALKSQRVDEGLNLVAGKVLTHPKFSSIVREKALEDAASSIRQQACDLVLGLWKHGSAQQKQFLLETLISMIDVLPSVGQNCKEFFQTMKQLISKETEFDDLFERVALKMSELICKGLNQMVCHPNSSLYAILHQCLEVDGYYLESEPCLICNNIEVPFSLSKLDQLQAESKFTDRCQLVKLVSPQLIQRFSVSLSEVRRLKLVKSIILYYNTKQVSDVTELRGKWNLWKKAGTIDLATDQLEGHLDLAIPIVATNIQIEFADFHAQASSSSQRMLCPRCNRPVTDRHGVCRYCRENAFQCRLCRNINYENLDAFLCNECGYCKHARFDYSLYCKTSLSVEPIMDEDDKAKAVLTMERESENAYKAFQDIESCKRALEVLFMPQLNEGDDVRAKKQAALSDGNVLNLNQIAAIANLTGQSVGGAVFGGVSKQIQSAAVIYFKDAKFAFQSMCNSMEMLAAVRKKLTLFLSRSSNFSNPSTFPALSLISRKQDRSCYGCASSFVLFAIGLIDKLSEKDRCRRIFRERLVHDLIHSAIHNGSASLKSEARRTICLLIKDDDDLTMAMLSSIQHKIDLCLSHHRALDLESVLIDDMSLLMDSCQLMDDCWEVKYRKVMEILFASVDKAAHVTGVAQAVILPALQILVSLCDNSQEERDSEEDTLPAANGLDLPSVTYAQWHSGEASYSSWKELGTEEKRVIHLQRKYGYRWLSLLHGRQRTDLLSRKWVTQLLLNSCSQAVRSLSSSLLLSVVRRDNFRSIVLLELLSGLLKEAAACRGRSAELFGLFSKLLQDDSRKMYLAKKGFIPSLCALISNEVERIRQLEISCSADISEGQVLKHLLDLLVSLLDVPIIRNRFKMTDNLLAEMLDNFLHVQSLIVQKTKLTDDCAQLLLSTFMSISSESEADQKRFCLACVSALRHHREGRTPVFLLQQLCNIMCPTKPEPTYWLILTKSPTQEEFIRGSMTKNPYCSVDIGTTMRDVKRKICTDLDLGGLMEDENGMELLVRGNIVRLDLPISLVYEQVWRPTLPESSDSPMEVIYRLQGLDGEATEPIVEALRDADASKQEDPEEEVAMTALMNETGGLQVLLDRVKEIDLSSAKSELEPLLLRLLHACCKLRMNRVAALKLGAVDIVLSRVCIVLLEEPIPPSAETMLLILESLVQEANMGSPAESEHAGDVSVNQEDNFKLLLSRLGSHTVRCRPGITNTLARIFPFLTYSRVSLIKYLVQCFLPHVNVILPITKIAEESSDLIPPVQPIVGPLEREEHEAYVDCLVSIVQRMGQESTACLLREELTARGVVVALTDFLLTILPSESVDKDDAKWREAIDSVELPRVLKLLTGMIRGYDVAQLYVDGSGILKRVHIMEDMSSDRRIGSLAEELLASLAEKNAELQVKVEALRQETASKKRELAKAQRERLLQEMGLAQGSSSNFNEQAKAMGWAADELEEEDGLMCIICHEGFRYKPEDVLGIYVLNKKTTISSGSAAVAGAAQGSPNRGASASRTDRCFTTVCNMSVVHMSCHQQATRAERNMKVPRMEWEGATLRNQNTKCNNILPIRGPATPSHMFTEHAEKYWATLAQLGRHEGSRFRMVVHDIRLLLLRLASGASFATDSGGGSAISNVKLVPFMVQMGFHCLGDGASSTWRQISSSLTRYVSQTSSDGVLSVVDGPDYHLVSTLWFPSCWQGKRSFFLSCLLRQALRGLPDSSLQGESWEESPEVFAQCRLPFMLFALVSRLHEMLYELPGGSRAVEDGALTSERWVSETDGMQGKLRNDHEQLLAQFEQLVEFNEQELSPCESLMELLDVADSLKDVNPPGDLKTWMRSVASQ